MFADRSAGVGGIIGRIPSGLSASFRIRDLGRAEDEVLTVELVDEPQLSALLLYVAGLEAAD